MGTIVLGGLIPAFSAIAGQLSNGQSFFNHPPLLIRTATTSHSRYTPATYQFTLRVPADAGEPLGAVKIAQVENSEKIAFEPNHSTAFIGDSLAGGPMLSLASIGGEQPKDATEVTVVFDPPVQPGKTVTVEIRATQNPNGGIYLFGVTAFPAGENSLGQFLGHGRLHFESGSGG
ncbi:MAG: DUF2808 domain-containing protein [Scytolyngbya sp. HA4215-MV1]|nr:DUF2808 domain-containing protein [Scytolyngbya sp. HA4215-MV1]